MAYAWALIEIGSELKKRVWDETGPDISGMIFRLHYKFTSSLLLLCGSILTMVSWFGSKPTRCTPHRRITGIDFDMYCWLHPSNVSTQQNKWTDQLIEYNLQGIGPQGPSEEDLLFCKNPEECLIRTVHYYQWTSIFLMFQALCFYTSRFLWTKWENRTMEYFLKTTHQETSVQSKAQCAAEMILYRANRGKNKVYASGYVLAEVGMGMNLVVQWAITNWFLGEAKFGPYDFSFYNLGWQTIRHPRHFLPAMMMFPRVTACKYARYSATGSIIEKANVLCLLPLNIINDKIFILLWFWFFFLSMLTLYKLIYRSVVFISPTARRNILDREISRSVLSDQDDRRSVLKTIAMSHSDFLFIEIFNNNNDGVLVQETMRKLRTLRSEEKKKHA